MPTINIAAVQNAMKQHGLSGRKLAERLEVSPQTVANWLSSASFPHPAQLLKLALSLRLPFEDLVVQDAAAANEPRVAARARMNRALSDVQLAELKGMGKLLDRLVPHLPFDTLESPPRLVSPNVDRSYLRRVSNKVREEIGVGHDEPLGFEKLVNRFAAHKAVLIPVMWGRKEGHENAIHVLLPTSGTTWVYLNLDTYIPDFKFWMSHELGHVYSPSLSGVEAEKFADAFAGALLFPEGPAGEAYTALTSQKRPSNKIAVLNDYAAKYGVSTYSVYREANNYASLKALAPVKITDALLHSVRHNENKKHGTLADSLWGEEPPGAGAYVEKAASVFNTVFFDTLRAYLAAENQSASLVQAMLDIPLLDAKALYSELV